MAKRKATAKKATHARFDADGTKFKNAKPFKGGIRKDFQSCIPPAGASFAQIAASAKTKLKAPERKVKALLGWLRSNGYVVQA